MYLPIENRTFHRQIISNGKLTALQKSDLRFEAGGKLAAIYVGNGDRISKGQAIAKLECFKLQNRLSSSGLQLQSAKLKLQDILLGMGHNCEDTTNIPTDIFEASKIKSGYNQAVNEYELAIYNLMRRVSLPYEVVDDLGR